MRSIASTLALCALFVSAANADTTVLVKSTAPWQGYMNVSNLPADGGAYQFGSGWGPGDLNSSFSGTTLTLSPNTIGDTNEYWYKNTTGLATAPNFGGPGQAGNKIMDASLYVQTPDGSLSGQTLTFSGNVSANTLTSAHTSVAFIKDFAPDYSSFNLISVPLNPGPFSISLALVNDPFRHVQYGFETIGVNVWSTDVAPFGSVKIDLVNVAPGNPNVKVDPAAAWQGYMNVFDPSNSGAYVFGSPWATKDLAAQFTGPSLTLRPNSIDDANYYDSGVGNKTMEANLYVETLPGRLSGQTVNFSGTVTSNTLSSTHTTIAYIKDFAPDYSSVVVQSVPLTAGAFNVSLATIANPTRHIQYGFQVVGPPVPPEELASFGSVQITTDLTASYTTWLSGFDFTAFTNPDLTKSGDPDGDGRNNFAEFALNSDPTNPASSGKVNSQVGSVGADNAMLLTLPVFNGATFAGAAAKTATIGQISYTIEGSNSLTLFNQPVSEVVPAVSEGLPAVGSGWSYRTFRLDGNVGGASPRGPVGFLRARTAPNP